MGATHFLMRRRYKVATEMALNVLAYNMKRRFHTPWARLRHAFGH